MSVVDDICKTALQTAEEEICCLTCRFSYFRPLDETGMCHNERVVGDHILPKWVNEFHRCCWWVKKK